MVRVGVGTRVIGYVEGMGGVVEEFGATAQVGGRGRLVLSVDLSTSRTSSLRDLRQWLRAGLYREREDCAAATCLVLGELVANAHDHGRSARGLRVWRCTARSVVRVEVEDACREDLPVLGVRRSGGARGSGLALVDGLAHRWGVVVHREGKTVWAELLRGATTDEPNAVF